MTSVCKATHGIMYKMSNAVEAEVSYEYKQPEDTAMGCY